MAYCTQTDIESHISRVDLAALTNDIPNFGVPDPDILGGLISHATTQINAQLAKLYNTPLPDPVPDIVNSIAVDIVLFLAYNRRVATFPVPATIKSEYEGACQTLADIAEGRKDLSDANGVKVEPAIISPEATIVASPKQVDFTTANPLNPMAYF